MAINWKQAKPATVKSTKDNSAKGRLLRNLDAQIALAKGPKSAEGVRWWTVDGDTATFGMKFSTKFLALGEDKGQPVLKRQWPVKEIAGIYESLKASVMADEFADQLAPLDEMTRARGVKAAATRAANKAK